MIRTIPSIEFRAMGCQMLAAIDGEDAFADRWLAAVPIWFEEWERRLSRFRAESELSYCNAHTGQTLAISPTLLDVIETALEAARQTDGLVTPTVLPWLEAAGYDRSFETIGAMSERLPVEAGSMSQRDRSLSLADATSHHDWSILDQHGPAKDVWRQIDCDSELGTLYLPTGVTLDLGGFAKGWAADLAAYRLGMRGPALIDAGGDIAISGPPARDEGWAIGVADPFDSSRQIGVLRVVRGGVATTGRDYRRWWRHGRCWHHLIDPRTGLPSETDLLATTVVGPSTVAAEIAAKAVLLLGSQQGLAWLEERPNLEGLLVREDGEILSTTGLSQYLWS